MGKLLPVAEAPSSGLPIKSCQNLVSSRVSWSMAKNGKIATGRHAPSSDLPNRLSLPYVASHTSLTQG